MKEKFESVKQENKRLLEIINAKPLDTVDVDSAFEIEKLKEQLQAKEQECEKLKHNYNAIKQCNDNNMQILDEAIKEKYEAEQELEKVKKQYKCYSCGTCNGKEDYYNLAGHHKNAIKSLHKAQRELDQLTVAYEQYKKKFQEFFNTDNQECWNAVFLKGEKAKTEQKLERIKDKCNETLELMNKDSGTNAYAGGRCIEAENILKIIDEVEL